MIGDFHGPSHLADQLARASTSIVLICEARASTRADKRRFYLTARVRDGVGRVLDVCLRLRCSREAGHQAGKERLVRIVSMLIKLAQSCEA